MTQEPPDNAEPGPGATAEEAMRTLWNALPAGKDYDSGMTLKLDSAPPDPAAETATIVEPLDATLVEEGEASASSASSVFHYKENSSVALRRSQLAGLRTAPPAAGEAGPDGGGEGYDFVIQRPLGSGGMGVVYVAKQTSMNREVAVKMVQPHARDKAGMANKLISEALVTGDLEHPGIVPVHELAHSADGTLFYAMKVVRGVPWSEKLPSLPERENLDILLRVADAVAFAHDRGVLHRDIKPENVMLGDYGEVLLLDWGLAVSLDPASKAETLSPANVKAGTPGYMAPEMALGQSEKIGPASDIYLLGAVLFEILAGKKPHAGANVYVCLAAAAANLVQPTDRDDRLTAVARRAMATEPGDRQPSVKAFREELGAVIHNLESITLSNNARASLDQAVRDRDYETFSQALFAFREAGRMWPDNDDAAHGEAETRRRYAECALAKRDYDLAGTALGQLDDPAANDLRRRIDRAKRDAARHRRLTRILLIAIPLLAVVAGGVLFRQHRRELEAVATAEEAEEKAAREIAGRRQFTTLTAYIRNRDFVDQQERDDKLIASIDDLRRTALALAARKDGEPLPREEERQLARLQRKARLLLRNLDWEFDAWTALVLRTEAGRSLGVPQRLEIAIGPPGAAKIAFSLVPAGKFIMGRMTDYREEGDPDEYPHLVRLSEPYYMGTTEVTRGIWRAAVGMERREDLETFFYSDAFAAEISEKEFADQEWARWGWRTEPLAPGDENLPASGVSWNEIQRLFLPAIRGRIPEGWHPALPTEAQWEFACRAGSAEPFHNGYDEDALARAGWHRESGVDGPQPAALLEPNVWGLYDMHGNVDELVADSYLAGYYLRSPVDDPMCDEAEFFRVMRGGNWEGMPYQCTSSYRDYLYRDSRTSRTGFRLALVRGEPAPPPDNDRPGNLIPAF